MPFSTLLEDKNYCFPIFWIEDRKLFQISKLFSVSDILIPQSTKCQEDFESATPASIVELNAQRHYAVQVARFFDGENGVDFA